eukprot:768527-Hanusia_phi.AAC.2
MAKCIVLNLRNIRSHLVGLLRVLHCFTRLLRTLVVYFSLRSPFSAPLSSCIASHTSRSPLGLNRSDDRCCLPGSTASLTSASLRPFACPWHVESWHTRDMKKSSRERRGFELFEWIRACQQTLFLVTRTPPFKVLARDGRSRDHPRDFPLVEKGAARKGSKGSARKGVKAKDSYERCPSLRKI